MTGSHCQGQDLTGRCAAPVVAADGLVHLKYTKSWLEAVTREPPRAAQTGQSYGGKMGGGMIGRLPTVPGGVPHRALRLGGFGGGSASARCVGA